MSTDRPLEEILESTRDWMSAPASIIAKPIELAPMVPIAYEPKLGVDENGVDRDAEREKERAAIREDSDA